jgi:hypothetical protein
MKILRFYQALGIVFPLSIALLGAAGALAQSPGHPPERGRELIGADGRTLTDKENKFAIRLPAANWKVFRDVDPGPEPFLNIADSNWELRLELRVKNLPLPLESIKTLMESEAVKEGTTFQRSTLSVRNGAKCWDSEGEEKIPSAEARHFLARVCDLDSSHKIMVSVRLPPAQWMAEEKALREMSESFRVNP